MSKWTWDDAYLALRSLLKARLMNDHTRQAAERALVEVQKEALTKTKQNIDTIEANTGEPPKAA